MKNPLQKGIRTLAILLSVALIAGSAASIAIATETDLPQDVIEQELPPQEKGEDPDDDPKTPSSPGDEDTDAIPDEDSPEEIPDTLRRGNDSVVLSRIADVTGLGTIEVDEDNYVTITEMEAGTLEEHIDAVVADPANNVTAPSDIPALTIEGELNTDDMNYIWLGNSSSGSGALSGVRQLWLDGARLSGTTTLPDYQFANSKLSRVFLPGNLTRIGEFAFRGSNVTYVSFSACDNLKEIGRYAFYYCMSLRQVTFNDSIEIVEDYAFQGCLSFASITNQFPASLKQIGRQGFQNAPFTAIDLNHCLQLQHIGAEAFSQNQQLRSLQLPACVITIGARAFQNTHFTNAMNFAGNPIITSIGTAAFGSSYIASLDLTDCVNFGSIPNQMLSNAYAIKTANFSGCTGIVTVGDRAFEWCQEIEEVNFSGCTSLTSMGSRVFEASKNCSIYLTDIPEMVQIDGSSTGTFYGAQNARVFVPRALIEQYRQDPAWAYWVAQGNVSLAIDDEEPAQYPVITTQPQGTAEAIRSGTTHTMSVQVDPISDGGTLSCQWYRCLQGNDYLSAELLTGATGTTYTTTALDAGTYVYFAVVTNSLGSDSMEAKTYSDVAVIYVYQSSGNQYKVSYHANGGSGTVPPGGNYYQGQTVNIAASNTLIPPQTNMRFYEWNTQADGSGTAYTPGRSIYMVEEDLTLYAIWEQQHALTIQPDGNGTVYGSGGDYYKNEEISIQAVPDVGYRFAGWSSSEGGSFANPGQKVTRFQMPDNDVTVTAKFVAIVDESAWDLQAKIDAAPLNIPTVIIIDEDIVLTRTDLEARGIQIRAGKNIILRCDGQDRSIKRTDDTDHYYSMFSIARGGKLTIDSDEYGVLTIDSNADNQITQACGSLFMGSGYIVGCVGEFVMNGGRLCGLNVKDVYSAAVVKVADSGNGYTAKFTMNGGTIENNNFYVGDSAYTAPVWLRYDSEMVMTGGAIQNNTHHEMRFQTAGAIYITNTSNTRDTKMLTMTGGTIAGNTGYVGGVYMDCFNPNISTPPGAAIFDMTGGTITGNTAFLYGGGVYVFGNAEFNLFGGEISHNTAPGGGGIAVYDGFDAGSFNVDAARTWSRLFPAKFTMTGGTVANNNAPYLTSTERGVGGGIFIATDNATISGGEIVDNYAYTYGGGIYIGKYIYRLRLSNALITENWADWGGGIWMCPLGTTYLYSTNGGAVFENRANYAGADVKSHKKEGRQHFLYLSGRMLGGGQANWFVDDQTNRYSPTNPVTGMADEEIADHINYKNVVSDSAQQAAKENAGVLIHGNISSQGGGIGTNGVIFLGNDTPTVEIEVEKRWQGNDIPNGAIPEKIKVYLTINGEVQEDDFITLSADNNWKASFTNLPNLADNSTYGVREDETAFFTGTLSDPVITEQRNDGDELVNTKYAYILTNTYNRQSVNLTIDKVWVAPAADIPDSVSFKIYADGELFDTAVLTRADGWSKTLENLPFIGASGQLINYTVEEIAIEGFLILTDKQVTDGQITFTVTNQKPSVQERKINIHISKEWLGDDTAARPAEIQIRLLANGLPTNHLLTLTAAEGWSTRLERLPLDDTTGKEIAYTIVETVPDGYAVTYKISSADEIELTLTAINTRVAAPVDPTTPNPPRDIGGTGDNTPVRLLFPLAAVSAAALAIRARRKRKLHR